MFKCGRWRKHLPLALLVSWSKTTVVFYISAWFTHTFEFFINYNAFRNRLKYLNSGFAIIKRYFSLRAVLFYIFITVTGMVVVILIAVEKKMHGYINDFSCIISFSIRPNNKYTVTHCWPLILSFFNILLNRENFAKLFIHIHIYKSKINFKV